VLELLRWHDELLDPAEFELPSAKSVSSKELDLASARRRHDREVQAGPVPRHYREEPEAQIERRVRPGNTEVVTEAPKEKIAGRCAGDRPHGGAAAEPRVEARERKSDAGSHAKATKTHARGGDQGKGVHALARIGAQARVAACPSNRRSRRIVGKRDFAATAGGPVRASAGGARSGSSS
jgi:hypothetical protein